jgi:tetratricopeptide (TPR) repeat protein
MPLFGRKKSGEDPADDLKAAQKALSKNDLSHALYHIGLALGVDPTYPEAQTMLTQVLAQTNNPLNLIPEEPRMHISTAALRADLLARHGRLHEAIQFMTQVMQTAPDIRYGVWVERWLDQPERFDSTSVVLLTGIMIAIIQKFPSEQLPDEATRQLLIRLIPKLAVLREKYPEIAPFGGVTSVISRKVGRLDEAVEIAETAFRREPSKITGVFLAKAYSVKGDHAASLAINQKVVEFDPNDEAVWLDIGDMQGFLGQPAAALESYQRALTIDPNNLWAKAHILYHRYLLTFEDAHLEELMALTKQNPNNEMLLGLLYRIKDQIQPYFNTLPPPEEAILDTIRKLDVGKFGTSGERAKTGQIDFTVTALEAPSAMWSVKWMMAKYIEDFLLHINITKLQKPDPRKPRREVKYLLWTYDGTYPEIGLPAPKPEIAEAVAALAKNRYSFDEWGKLATQLGPVLGPTAIPDLLAVMCNVPPPPENWTWWDWVQAVQIAAALVIGQTEMSWENSERRAALHSLLYGPLDWTISAAALALTQIALAEPALKNEAVTTLQEVLALPLSHGYVPHQAAIEACLKRLG